MSGADEDAAVAGADGLDVAGVVEVGGLDNAPAILEALSAKRPVVLFIDGAAARKIWPGLPNTRLGKGPLPGDVQRERGKDVAVVRVSTAVAEIGRPVTRHEKAILPRDR